MLGDLALAYWFITMTTHWSAESLLLATGYQRRRAIYGRVLFAEDEWVKVA